MLGPFMSKGLIFKTTPLSSNLSPFPRCQGSIQFIEEYRGKYGYRTRQRSFEGSCDQIVQQIVLETNFGGNPHVKITDGDIQIQVQPRIIERYKISPSIPADINSEKTEQSDLTSLNSIKQAFNAALNYSEADRPLRIAMPLWLRGSTIPGLRIRREDDLILATEIRS